MSKLTLTQRAAAALNCRVEDVVIERRGERTGPRWPARPALTIVYDRNNPGTDYRGPNRTYAVRCAECGLPATLDGIAVPYYVAISRGVLPLPDSPVRELNLLLAHHLNRCKPTPCATCAWISGAIDAAERRATRRERMEARAS